MIYDRASASTLGFLRAWIYTIWFGYILINPAHTVSKLPLEAFKAPGLLLLIPNSAWALLLDEKVLAAFHIALLACVGSCAIALVKHTSMFVATACALVYYQGILRGFCGHINHSELGLLYSTFGSVRFSLSKQLRHAFI